MSIFKFSPFRNPLRLKHLFSREHFNRRRIFKWSLRVFLGFILLILLMFAWFAKDLPTPGKIKHYQASAATQIFDRNGKELYAIHGDTKRILVNSSDIPEVVKEATITAEDRTFYSNHGFNIKGILRAIYYDVTRKHSYLSGGSTITQQFVKNAMLDPKKTLTRKIKEFILTIEVEIMYDKDEILTMYLNEIPYGSYNYGIEAASESFFNKDAKDLNLAEAATLAALPQRPSYYSPYGIHPDERNARVAWVLDSMADLGYISRDEANAAKKDAKNIQFSPQKENIQAPHFVMYIKELLVDQYGEQKVDEGGLKVTTTLDGEMQKAAEEAITAGANRRFDSINASNASLVAIDPKTGQVLAMVGSIDYFNNDIDGQVNVAISDRQPGSAFKPIVYATAFKKEYNPAFTLWDVETDFGDYTPHNYDGTNHGPVSMRQALAGSLNVPAVKTLYLAGINNALDQAHQMGITTLNDTNRYGLSLVLGGGEVKLLDLTTAYGVFANSGTLVKTTPILKIQDNSGKVLAEYKEEKSNVLDPQIAYEVSSILSDNGARAFVFGSNSALYFPDRMVAAKTGTTSEYRDAWTVGYTPQIVAGVWVGNNDNSPMTAGAAGAMAAAPIWHDFMEKALANQPAQDFVRPDGIKEMTVDKYTNKLPQGGDTITDIFASWQIPKDYSHDVGTVRIDKYTGHIATEDCPAQYTTEKTVMDVHSEQPDNPAWEGPVRSWAASMGLLGSSVTEGDATCAGLESKTSIRITSPANNASLTSNFTITTAVSSNIGIRGVEFFVDDASIGSSTSSPYSFTYSASGLTVGKHKITAVVTDENNTTSTSSVIISKTGRVVTPTSPAKTPKE